VPRFRLVPSDDEFFRLFKQSAANAQECANRLRAMLDNPSDVDAGHARVVECEQRGDEITDSILRRLTATFVTPFDREDIHALAEELDDVVDDMLTVSHLLRLIRVGELLPELKEQADILVQMAGQAVELVNRLEPMKGIEPYLASIDRLESEGDAVYRRILARLFSGEFDALTVIQWKDMVEAMEAALNTVEDISNVVESIVLKHA
jgi:predicted phosphate transport protein (TIGR00153 family)